MTIVVRVETESQDAKDAIRILGMQRDIPVKTEEDGALSLSFEDRFGTQADGVQTYLERMPMRFAGRQQINIGHFKVTRLVM